MHYFSEQNAEQRKANPSKAVCVLSVCSCAAAVERVRQRALVFVTHFIK